MKCIIVDDEMPSREELKYFIETFSQIEIKGSFASPAEAIKFMKKESNKIDIAFLDVSMPRINGMELAKILIEDDKNLKIVFITAYKEYAVDAFEIKAYDYLLKPFSKKRIIDLLDSFDINDIENTSNEKNIEDENISKLTVWDSEKMIVLNNDDIYYFEASERITLVITKDSKYTINESISMTAKKLNKSFFKCHRSFIVNLEKITEIIPWFNSTYMLGFKGIEQQIPVSRNNISKFRELMHIK